MTLRYGPDRWVPSSFMPTLPGRLFFLRELAGPLGRGVQLRASNKNRDWLRGFDVPVPV